jgi:hypothetical protein
MELKREINLKGLSIIFILKTISSINLKDKDFDFLYGIDEYTEDYKKIKKQFKRLL